MTPDTDQADGDRSVARRLLTTVRPLLAAGLVVVLVALVAGVVFSRTDPRRAAQLLLGDLVVTEPEGRVTGGPAPSSGERQAAPTCGIFSAAPDAQVQVDALAGGIVVLQYRDTAAASEVEAAVSDRTPDVLVAPNPALDQPVVATAWGRRMVLDTPDRQLIRAFVTAHSGIGPRVEPCAA